MSHLRGTLYAMLDIALPQITCGRIELRQATPGADVTLRHTSATGAVVEVRIAAAQLERWAVRQIRQEAFR